MQSIPDAVDVVVGPGELAGDEAAWLVFHELFEAVLVQLLVLHVVVLVLLYKQGGRRLKTTRYGASLHRGKKSVKNK